MLSDLAYAVGVLLLVGVVVIVGSAVYMGVRAVRWCRRLVHTALPTRPATLTDATWWANQRDRRRLWRSVTSAERAVRAAGAAGVPTGDLPGIARELRTAAVAVDVGLRAGRTAELRRQVAELTAAADDVGRAATLAIAADAQPLTSRVVDAVRVELAALRH